MWSGVVCRYDDLTEISALPIQSIDFTKTLHDNHHYGTTPTKRLQRTL